MLTINNLNKIVRYQIDTFRVKSMICGITFYHISLIDGKGQHRDLKLNRMKGKHDLYTISYGKYVYHLDFAEIKDMDAFCAQIKKLIC
jgi:hypothetical protein